MIDYKGMNTPLTEKQKVFADLYAIHLNGTKAAILAGYSENSARVTASKMLANDSLQTYLWKKRRRIADKYDLFLENSIVRILDTLTPNFCDFVKWDNKNNIWLKSLEEIPAYKLSAIKSLRVFKSGAFDLRLHDKNQGLKIVGKLLGQL